MDRFKNTLMMGGQKELADRLIIKYNNVRMEGGSILATRILFCIFPRTFKRMKEIQMKKSRSSSSPSEVEVNPVRLIKTAVENAKPVMGLQTVRVGSVTYTVPTPITDYNSTFQVSVRLGG